jgi:PAS domain S-box-containing protein
MPVEINQKVQQKTHLNISSLETIFTIISGAAAAFLGTISIIGLFFNIVFLSAVLPEFKPIAVSAAIAWIFFGLVLAIHAKKPLTGARLTVVTAFLVVIAMAAALDIPLKLMGKSFLIEDLVNNAATQIMSGEITQVSPIAAFFIILSAIGIFVLLHGSRGIPDRQNARNITGISGFLIAFLSFTVLLSYGLGAPLLYKTTIIPIAFTSALAALFTGLGLITSAGSSSLPLWYFTGPDVRSRLLRSFLPLIVIIVLTQGLLQSTLISVWRIDNVIEVAIGLMLFCLITIFVVSKVAGDVSQLIENEEEKRRNAERALSESERKYRNLYQYANVGLFETSLKNATIIACNQRYCSLSGFSSIEEAIGKDVIGLYVNPEERNEVTRILRENGSIDNYTARFRNQANGKEFWGQFSARYNYERDVAEGSIVDISEQKEAEANLKETNAYLTILYDYANAPIIVWDTKFRIIRFNHALERLTGLMEKDVVGEQLEILFPESSRNVSLEAIRQTLTGERWEGIEIPIRNVSGEMRIVLWNSANIVDPQGTLISTIAQGQDITERKNAEEALKKNEHKFQTLADFTYDWAYWIDTDFRMVYTSPSCEKITGYSPEDFIGNRDLMVTIVYPDDRDIYLKHRSDMHYKPAAGMLEFRILHHDGSVRWLGHVCRPIFDIEGQFLGTRVSNRDITEQKAIERQREALIRELEQKNAELERFTYTISHDLKSPLITIKGFAGLLEDDALKSDPLQLKKDVQRITVAADTMQELLTDVLELSRIGRVISPLEHTPFGVIVQEAINLLSLQLEERHVTVSIAPDLPVVKVDHARIREVMVNLIENAIKFFGDCPDPVIKIGVDNSGKIPVFFVQDNGIGIDPRYLERIFNLFEKLNISAQGTGVGLTIVRRIIEFHGGRIWAESEGVGRGTTFRFTLPGPAEVGNSV